MIAVVVPTIREECIYRWLCEWGSELRGAQVIIVEDNPERSFKIPSESVATAHYSWHEIEEDLGDESWIIPRRTSAIKSYGFLKAYQAGADIIWTLDDDCYPEPDINYLGEIAEFLSATVPETLSQDLWWNTIEGTGLFPRGYPYGIRCQHRPVVVNHGLWSDIPDLDGLTQRDNPHFRLHPGFAARREVVPRGAMFPMCGMNLAWRREMTPAMYFMLQGRDYPFDRFDDMWAGLMVKRIADHLNLAITSGAPSIHHTKASDVEVNIRKEGPGIEAHERLWPLIAAAPLTANTVAGCYRELAAIVRDADLKPRGYWKWLACAMALWADLF